SKAPDGARSAGVRSCIASLEDGEDAAEDAVVVLVLEESFDLALVEEDAAAVRALIDAHTVEVDRRQIHPALRALHVMGLAHALPLLGGHLRGVLFRPLPAALELLPCEVFVLGLAGLGGLGHVSISSGARF